MKSSRKVFQWLAISLLLVASIKAQVPELPNPDRAVESIGIEAFSTSTEHILYEDYVPAENNTEKRIISYDESSYSALQRKYIVTLVKLNWYAAYAFCDQNGWSLVGIESALEQFQVQNYLNYFNLQNNNFWTSGNKLADLQNYRWGYNGSTFSYTNWVTGGPNGFMGGQHCVKLQESTLKWENDFCDKQHHFICQMDRHPFTQTWS